jgi:hypothetical protein
MERLQRALPKVRITRDRLVAAAIIGTAFVMTVLLQPGLTAKIVHDLGF